MSSARVIMQLKPKGLKGKLMKIFTGCFAYHCGFLGDDGFVYDMHFTRRRVLWQEILESHPNTIFEIYRSPVTVTTKYLIERTLNDNTYYGFIDLVSFVFRWAYHLVGKSTPNQDGVICSEMVYNDLQKHGWKSTFVEVPSPCGLRAKFRDDKLLHKVVFGAGVFKDRYDPISRDIPRMKGK